MLPLMFIKRLTPEKRTKNNTLFLLIIPTFMYEIFSLAYRQEKFVAYLFNCILSCYRC